MSIILWGCLILAGVALIVWGADVFADHLAAASVRLGVSAFAVTVLLAGAEPEELATAVTASLRNVPAVAFGDIVGTNIAMTLIAVAVAAFILPIKFDTRTLRYMCITLLLGGLATYFTWDGTVSRIEGFILVVLYIVYVGGIWRVERRIPDLGEVEEVKERLETETDGNKGVWKDVALVAVGLGALVLGSLILVEAVRQLSGVETIQTTLSLTLVGVATAFELIVLAWSTARRGMPEVAIAAVLGSFVYNSTMSFGAAALVRPLAISDAFLLHLPLLIMPGSLGLMLLVALPKKEIDKMGAGILLLGYCIFVLTLLFDLKV